MVSIVLVFISHKSLFSFAANLTVFTVVFAQESDFQWFSLSWLSHFSVCDMWHNFRYWRCVRIPSTFANEPLFFSAVDFASCTLREKIEKSLLLSVAFSVSSRSQLSYKMASDKAVLDAFNRFDTDGSGSISREELGEARLEGENPLGLWMSARSVLHAFLVWPHSFEWRSRRILEHSLTIFGTYMF